MKQAPFPSPRSIVERWQRGEIKREELHHLMTEHHQVLLQEADDYHTNPIAGYLEGLRNKRAARKLLKQHSEAAVRELLLALSGVPDFPPSAFLWNANHWDLPLHAFLRANRAPRFVIRELVIKSERAVMLVSYSEPLDSALKREKFTFRRHWRGDMELSRRERA